MKPIDEILIIIKDEVKTIDNNLNDYLSDEKISFVIKELVKNHIDEIIRIKARFSIDKEIIKIIQEEADYILDSDNFRESIKYEIKAFVYSNEFRESIIKVCKKIVDQTLPPNDNL